jgi:hypothetical protein
LNASIGVPAMMAPAAHASNVLYRHGIKPNLAAATLKFTS